MNRKICPRCEKYDISLVKSGSGMGMFSTRFQCADCGFTAAFFPEEVDDEK